MQLIQFIIVGLKRPKQKEVNKLKGIKFKVLFKFKEENIQLKKKEFNYLYKDVKTNLARAIVDKKFGELAIFFRIVILIFYIYRGELTLQFNQQKLILKNSYLKLVILQANPNNTKAVIIIAIAE